VTEIVPRWEWRTFDVGSAASGFETLTPYDVVDSSEIYLLSAVDADVVKIRADLMDVKHLREVHAVGLELWTPVMKARFPLPADDLVAALGALGVSLDGPPARPSYTVAGLLREVVEPHPELLALEVRKHRRRYLVDGCMVELTDVSTDRGSTRTVAVESEDADLVIATIDRLGLSPGGNTNYGRGMKRLVGFPTRCFAVVDVGTNSVKFHIGERLVDGAWRTVVDRADVTRLGEGLQKTGRLNPEPMARTVAAITAMVEESRRHRVAGLAVVGTAGLRTAANGGDLARSVRERCGAVVETISGDDEARLAYRAATADLASQGSRVVFDTGGGSSQFSFGEGDRVEERFSVEVGAVRFTEQFGLDGAVDDDVLAGAFAAIEEALARLDGRPSPETLVGMGGALTNLAAVRHGLSSYDPDVVHGTVLDTAEIDRQIELYRTRSTAERRTVVGLQPARAEVILAGACIVRTVMRTLGADHVRVSDRGLRYGLLAERFGWTPGTARRPPPEVP
jgi:exopolyphosphatase/guanosine-5'-triphosphate,3'-diphosphate pyrophosphatase